MVAAGAGSVAEVMTPPAITARIEPDPALRPAFAEALAAFRASYPAIRAIQ